MRFDMKHMPRLVLRQLCRRMLAPKLDEMAKTLKERLAEGGGAATAPQDSAMASAAA